MTREERIEERRKRWAPLRTEADPIVAVRDERLKKLAKLAASPEWDIMRDVLDECAKYRLIAFDQPNWAILTAVEQSQAQLARRLVAMVEEAPEKVEKLMDAQAPIEQASA